LLCSSGVDNSIQYVQFFVSYTDADWSLNAGNWMWLSASAFFHQYFRVYSPVAFGKKTDKNGDYIR
jgi:deoxyribodipyrimidine photolyase